jgi:hypothetical protein
MWGGNTRNFPVNHRRLDMSEDLRAKVRLDSR